MRSKQITWKSSVALAISTLTILVGSSSCASLFFHFRNASVATISVASIQPLRSVQGSSTWVYALAISPDGRFLASGSYDKKIKIWDLPSNTLLYTLKGHGDAVVSLAISPDSKLLASGSWDNRIKLWNLETGQLLRTLDGHTDDVEAVAISPNGKWLASGSADTTIRIWNVQTGVQVHQLSDQKWVRTVAFSPDGQTLASGNEDGTLKIWRLMDGAVLKTLNAHSQAVRSVTFSPDGRTLASGSADRKVKLWQMPTGKLLHSLIGHDGVVWSVAFSPDGKRLASGGNDSTIKLWGLPIDRFAAILQAKGITVFARIDQQAEAEKVGLSLPPTQLLLFGNPKAGTPLMVAKPTIALDLPLKVLAWEATDGKTWVSYNDPNYLKQRFSLSDELVKNIAIIAPLIHQALL